MATATHPIARSQNTQQLRSKRKVRRLLDDQPVRCPRLVEFWRRTQRRRRITSALLLIIGGALGIFALGTAYTLGPYIAPFGAAALVAGGALYPTPMRLLCGLLGAVILVGWTAAVIW